MRIRTDRKYRGKDGTIYTVEAVIVPEIGTVGNEQGDFVVIVRGISAKDPLGIEYSYQLDREEFCALELI